MRRPSRIDSYMLVFLTFLVQLIINSFITNNFIRPNLLVIAIIFLSLFSGKEMGLEAGIAGGLLLDLFSIRLFGLNIFLLGLTGWTVGSFNNKFYKDSRITHAILVFIATYFTLSVYFLFVQSRAIDSAFYLGFKSLLTPRILIPSLINSVLGIFFVAFLLSLFKITEDIF